MKALELMARFGRTIEGIVHVGANKGQETHAYRQLGEVPCILVEPIPSIFEELERQTRKSSHHHAVRALCSDTDGEHVTFNLADNGGEASSMFNASAHLELFPSVRFTDTLPMVTTTLDTILDDFERDSFNLLIMDAQGAELKILDGAARTLNHIDGIFTEVAELPLYEGGATLEQVQAYLRPLGFMPKWLRMNQFHYGDAFFLREAAASPLPVEPGENLALKRLATTSSVWWNTPAAVAQGGNNGKRTGTFGFHTAEEPNPWWQVDLGSEQRIREIRIFNRLDAGSERARSLHVLVSGDGIEWTQVHDQRGRRFGGIDGNPLRVILADTTARYVRICLPETQFLHLDEVEVY